MTDDSRTGALPDHNAWPAFTIAWDDNLPGPTDVSYLLEKPAGATGFIRVVDGHLATGDGKRWRIWGQHFEHSMSLPPMDLAPIIARRLGKFGINCLRLHFLDSSWPNGILMRNTTSTRALDPEAMARFDWFVACCKREGVYLDLNLHVGRVFSDLDGVQQAATVGWGKPINYFDEWLISLQKEYARQVLEHVNPFTGNRYAEEPAIALIEITNENGLIEQWFRDLLRGENTARRTNWGDIPPAYAKKLDALWNAWLARKYPDRLALSAAWDGDLRDHEDVTRGSVRRLRRDEFDATAAARFRDEVSFYSSIERQFFGEMKSFLRGELGARQLILGTSDHHPAWSGLPLAAANTTLDLTDSHSYWQHPTYANAQGPGVPPYSYVGNQAMVDDPDHSSVAHLSRAAVEGYPHICSEVNEPCPNDSAAEFIPIIAAYARFQDWDGVIFYNYGMWNGPYWREDAWSRQELAYWFDFANHPVKMAQTALGALTFLRGDVAAAHETVARCLPRERVLESVREPGTRERHPYWQPGLPGRLALVHRTRIADLDAAALSPAEGEVALPGERIVSDTGELTWENVPDDGRVLIDAPRQQAIIGRVGRRATRNLILDVTSAFAAVQLASLDDREISHADRLLLVIGTRATNTDFAWADDQRHGVASWGHAPTRIEPLAAKLALRNLEGATGVRLCPLDGHGQPVGESYQFAAEGDVFTIRLPVATAAPWYLIEVMRF